ncbi:MAG: ParB/RepB/Spo0J family partition protein [Candidatus Paceibacterota bacterium]
MAFQGDSIYWVEVEKIVPNPFQPRREFDEQKLKELSESVRMYGILQPLTVTRKEIQREDGTFYTEYELIAGERRLRASKLAGLNQVPVIIREGEDSEQEKLELAIIENLQREDLNAVDRALAFRQLADVFGLSHVQVARKVGRSREYVSNSIRLLGLPDYMQNSLRLGEMTEGHARTLLMLNDRPEEQDVVFREILLKKLSVREVERIVRKIATDKVRKKDPAEFDSELIEMEKKFMETLGTRVQIQKTDYGGKLTIDYFSVEDLEAMLVRMKAEETAPTVETSRHAQLAALVANTPLAESVSAKEELESEPYKEEGRFDVLMSATDKDLVTEGVTTAVAVEADNVPVVSERVLETDPVNSESLPESMPVVSADVPEETVVSEVVVEEVPTQALANEDVSASNEMEVNIEEVPAPVEEVKSEEKPESEKKVDEDDNDLYSLRNFGI